MTQATAGLDEKTIEIVKSTVPVLEQHGEKITTRFYEMMFANHLELLNIFNHANQRAGKQQRALANAVYAAAAYIDNLEAILPAVRQIAHKHRSLQIKPEHYPIVGKHLLLAIKDVLGDAATDEIINAWEIAYGEIANVFIQVEQEMYEQAAEKQGGWKGFRNFQVVKKVEESSVITSFYLKPKDGQAFSDFLPGQYVSVRFDIPGEKNTHIRQYSLSDAPGQDYYRISVKKETNEQDPDGIVSNYLHETIQEGDTVELTAPAGDFTLNMNSTRPVVLLSGGVGLTPMMSMLQTLVNQQPNRDVTFIHAAINRTTHAMHEQVKQLADEHKQVSYYVCYEKPTAEDRAEQRFDKEGFVDLKFLQSVVKNSEEAEFYFCGPVPFMQAVNNALKEWEIPEERRMFEFFGPKGDLE